MDRIKKNNNRKSNTIWRGFYGTSLSDTKESIELNDFSLTKYIESIDISILYVNNRDGSLNYVSDNVQNVLGIAKADLLKDGIKLITNRLIVNHIGFTKVITVLFQEIFNSWSVRELLNLKLSVVGLQLNRYGNGRVTAINCTTTPNNSDGNELPIKTIALIQDITNLAKGENYWIRLWNTVNMEQTRVYHSNSDFRIVSDILTRREKEILTLIIEGNTYREIANILHISCHTVNNHRQKILDKFGVSDTSALITVAKIVSFNQWGIY